MSNVKVGQGALFRQDENDRRSPESPTHTGQIEFTQPVKAGTKVRIAAWVTEPKRGGQKYFSIAASVQEDERAPSRNDRDDRDRDDRRGRRDELDDEIPF